MVDSAEMAPFDIIDTVGMAYQKVWQDRRFLARAALVPYVLKVLLFSVSLFFGITQKFTLQALVLLPSFLAEGWLMVVVSNLVFFDKAIAGRPLLRRSYAMAGIVAYSLIKFLQTGAMTFVYDGNTPEPGNADSGAGAFMVAFAAFALTIWAFRYLWIYIPLSVNISLKHALNLLKRPSLSIYMIGLWLLCLVPFMVLMMLITSVVMGPYGSIDEISGAVRFILTAIQAGIDLTTNIVATAAMAYAFRFIIEGGGRLP